MSTGKSRDGLVKLAAYAAFTSAGVSLLNLVLTLILTAKLRDTSNQDLLPTFQSIRALALGVGWGLLILVAVGLFRLARPSSVTSKLGLIFAGLGGAVVLLSELLVAATGTSGTNFLSPHGKEAGELAVAVWLVLANSDLRGRGILSKGLTQTGLVFGFGVAIVSIGLLLNARIVSAGLLVTVGFLVWPSWLGIALLRPLPITASSTEGQS